MWRDFPTACRACDLVQRVGVFALRIRQFRIVARARTVRDMHEEALVALLELLDRLAIEQPILIGHSDGASIALIHAGGSGRAVRGLVLLAPHVFVEEITVASIAAANVAYETTDLRERLAKHHR